MSPMETAASLVRWATANTAYNLGFIPEDKLAWKPAPTALSALEIANHMSAAMRNMLPALAGGDWTRAEFPQATNLKEAQELVTSTGEEYARALTQLHPEDLQRTINHPRF